MATPLVASARESSCGVVTMTAPVNVMHWASVICTSPVPTVCRGGGRRRRLFQRRVGRGGAGDKTEERVRYDQDTSVES